MQFFQDCFTFCCPVIICVITEGHVLTLSLLIREERVQSSAIPNAKTDATYAVIYLFNIPPRNI